MEKATYGKSIFFKSRAVLASYEVGNIKRLFIKFIFNSSKEVNIMKTYYFLHANCELIETAEFETDSEAFDHCFTNPEICTWNDKPNLDI